jgi:hypothetical protein
MHRRRKRGSLAALAWALGLWLESVALGEQPLFPPELVAFGPASPQPLLAGGGRDAWDCDLRERGWIVRDGATWRLWYTGSNPERDRVRRLGLATSADGLNWTRSDRNPLTGDLWVEDMCVVRSGGRLMMFAEGRDDIAHRLVSCDGLRWQACGPLDIRLAGGAAMAAGPRGTPTVWRENGLWHLFYERGDKGVWLATSRDLRTFTNVSDTPVIACGPEAYDRHAVACDQILKYRGRYYAYYHASAAVDWSEWNTCIATSDDLVHWRKYAGNPVLPPDPAHPKRSSATLVFDGRRHRLYTTHPDVRVRFSVEEVSPPP